MRIVPKQEPRHTHFVDVDFPFQSREAGAISSHADQPHIREASSHPMASHISMSLSMKEAYSTFTTTGYVVI